MTVPLAGGAEHAITSTRAVDHVFYENAISADQGGTELFRAAFVKAGGKMDQIGVYLNAMR